MAQLLGFGNMLGRYQKMSDSIIGMGTKTDTEKLVQERKAAMKLSKPCYHCGSKQVQLTWYNQVVSNWKCRQSRQCKASWVVKVPEDKYTALLVLNSNLLKQIAELEKLCR